MQTSNLITSKPYNLIFFFFENEGKDSKKKRKSKKIKGKTCHRQELNCFKQKLSYKETGRGVNIKKGISSRDTL